jgi:hypothetical protein
LLPQEIKLFCEVHARKVMVYQPEKPQPQPPAPTEYCKVCSAPLFLPSGEELCGHCWRGIEYGFDSEMGRSITSLGQDEQPSQQQAIPGMSHDFAAFKSIPGSCHHLTQEAAQVQQQQQPPHFSRDRATISPKTYQLPRLQEQIQNPNSQPPNDDGSQHYGEQRQALVAQPLQREDWKKAHGQNKRRRLPEGHPHQSSKVIQMERGRQLHRNGSDEATGKQQTRQPPPRNAEKLDLEKGERLHQGLVLKKPQQELSHLSQEQAQEEEHKMDQVQHDAEQLSPAEKHAKFWDDYPACKCAGRRLVAGTWQTEKHWPKCPLNLSSEDNSMERHLRWAHRTRWINWAKGQVRSMENPTTRFCDGLR